MTATYVALLGLAFTSAMLYNNLTLQQPLTRWFVLQKARRHIRYSDAPTLCRHMVSGSISLP